MTWEKKKQGNQTVLYSSTGGFQTSGISIYVNKKAKTLDISGYYDGCVGIQGGTLTLEEIQDLFKKEPKNKNG